MEQEDEVLRRVRVKKLIIQDTLKRVSEREGFVRKHLEMVRGAIRVVE